MSNKKTVIAIGKFDGVHIGHRELLRTAVDAAAKEALVSLAFIITSDKSPMLLPPQKREERIKSFGIDKVYIQALNSEFMNLSADDFVESTLLDNFNCAHVIVGYNFRFAKGRSADANDLKAICESKGIECTIIPEVTCTASGNKITASSSVIRDALTKGDVNTASDILDRPYTLWGVVDKGRQIGRTIDIPTANMLCGYNAILPKEGVYATITAVDGVRHRSITNIGSNPTVNPDGDITIETNILDDFSGDIYGEEMAVEFIERIRDEMKFASLEELKKQIEKDINYCLSL